MRTKFVAVAALAGGLLMLPLAHGGASAMPGGLKNLINTTQGSVELVGKGGGGGGGGGAARRRRRRFLPAAAVGGGKAIGGGGGPRGGGFARGGGRPSLGTGPRGGGSAYRGRGGGREFSGRTPGRQFSGRNVNRNWDRGGRDFRGGRYAYRDRGKHDRHHYRNRNRDVFIYGAPFVGYGAYAYAGDCYWLRQQASPPAAPIGGTATTLARLTTTISQRASV